LRAGREAQHAKIKAPARNVSKMRPKFVYANVEQSRPGSFCPPLFVTANQAYAKRFYAALFGWETQDFRTGPNDGFLKSDSFQAPRVAFRRCARAQLA
jgi:hypothetical protein